MAFNHKGQKDFYIDYAIKNGMNLNESILNLFNVRLKKETTDIFNKLQLVNGLNPLEWRPADEYETNEIVYYQSKSYKCLQDCINKVPSSEPSFWKEVTYHDYTKFPMDNYLSKDNQTPYEPSHLQQNEESNLYHPTTVKYLEERLKHWFDNEIVTNSDRLDGEHKDYFCSKEEFEQRLKNVLDVANVVDNLDSDSRRKPLSAYQGKVLKQYINHINAILSSNDMSLDEIQEIINWIKTNRAMIETLGIDSINGLRTYLNKIDNELDTKVSLDYWNTEFLKKIKEVDGHLSGVDADLLDGKEASYFLPASMFTAEKMLELINRLTPSLSKINADKLDNLDSSDFLRRTSSDAPTRDSLFDLGSSAKRWANIYALNFQGTALKAKYADLAEIYDLSRYNFEPGTVIGYNRVSKKYEKYNSNTIYFGVVSTNPGLILNKDTKGTMIALSGQVPVQISNYAEIGDYIIADDNNEGKGVAVKDYDFNESKRLIGIAIEDSMRGVVKTKI